jgi:spore coat polysaccharide biosynthesis protein SpsF
MNVQTLKTVCTIEARMRSTRLPGKVLRPILGRPMLALMIERLQRIRQVDDIVVATTDNPTDDAIADLACQAGVKSFRGSEQDVLNRVLEAARSVRADLIVETTGDCPLIDPGVIDQLIATFKCNSVDYCSNVLSRTYPRGMDAQVFPVVALTQVAQLTQDPTDHEHVSLYIYEHPERFRLLNIASGLAPEIADLRLTVDTPEDFDLVSCVFESLYPANPAFTLADILTLFECQPELRRINQNIQQKPVH